MLAQAAMAQRRPRAATAGPGGGPKGPSPLTLLGQLEQKQVTSFAEIAVAYCVSNLLLASNTML